MMHSASLLVAHFSFSHPSLTSPFCLFSQAVRLESAYPQVTRYMVVVSTNGRQDTEESIVLGMDFVSSDRSVPQQQYTTLVCSVILTLIIPLLWQQLRTDSIVMDL